MSAARLAAALARRYGPGSNWGQTPDSSWSSLLGSDLNWEALTTLNERSVCRRYRRDRVPEPLLRLLCATALAAPTKSDLQQATIVRVADPAKRAAIVALLPGSPWLAGAPELLVFCADGFRLRRLFARRNAGFPNEHLDAFFNATVDAALVLGAFVTAAELAGLGTCPISQIRDHVEKVDELLALPDWVVPVAGLALGYPEAKEPLSARLSLCATVHTDRYDPDAVERELDAYDTRRGRDWSGDKVRQYSTVWRAGFGAYVERKRFKPGM
jgi:FMN reductase [NAD(P)H]